jgi:hypothetical protein
VVSTLYILNVTRPTRKGFQDSFNVNVSSTYLSTAFLSVHIEMVTIFKWE